MKLSKKTKKKIFFFVFTIAMIYLLTQTDLRQLVKDIAKQAWIFIAMLVLKGGEEAFWRPMIVSKFSEEEAEIDTESK